MNKGCTFINLFSGVGDSDEVSSGKDKGELKVVVVVVIIVVVLLLDVLELPTLELQEP